MYTGLILSDVMISQDFSEVLVPAGTLIVLESGGALEAQIGLGNIVNVTSDQSTLTGLAAGVSN